VASKLSIGIKFKAGVKFKPEAYIRYCEALNEAPNAESGLEGRFSSHL